MTFTAMDEARAKAAVVTASRRLSRALAARYDRLERARGAGTWPAPRILPWGAWLRELWDAYCFAAEEPAPLLLDANQEQFLWQRIIEDSPESRGLLQVAATARAAQRSWKLVHAWRLDWAAIAAGATEDTRAFLTWAEAFDGLCRERGWLDEARLPDALAARLGTLPAAVFAGFDEFTPQQIEVLGGPPPDGCAAPQPEGCATVAFADRNAEIEAAARWARLWAGRGADGVAVVVPNLDKVRPLVERVFSDILDPGAALPAAGARRPAYNISAAPALDAWPLVRAALLALSLEPGANELTAVSRLLRSPWFSGADAEFTRRGALDAELRQAGAAMVSIARLERRAGERGCPALAQALSRWSRLRADTGGSRSPALWAWAFSALLEALGWPGPRSLSSAEYQTVERWRELLSEFARLEIVAPQLPWTEARSFLARLARETLFQPETENAPVQILDILETPGLEFEHLWVAGLDDETWPRPAAPDPFLPAALGRARNLPRSSPARELAFARRTLDRLLASAPDVVLSYPLREEDRELGPSPLIAHLPTQGIEELALPSDPTFVETIRASSAIETLDDRAGPPLEAGAPGGANIFKYQASCPFHAFAELRLGARPLELPEPGLAPPERGLLVHKALETIWGELRTSARLCALGDELLPLVRGVVLRALDALNDRRLEPLPARFAALEQKRLEALLIDWLKREKARRPFTVIRPEGEREIEVGGLRARIRIDRVDRLEDGREVIVDYKTGRVAPHPWDGDRPDEPQLPLYAVTHEAPLAGVVFAKLRPGELGFQGYEDGAGIDVKPADLAAVRQAWRGVLERLAADFRSGVADVDPKDASTCRHCKLAGLCRITEAVFTTSALTGEARRD